MHFNAGVNIAGITPEMVMITIVALSALDESGVPNAVVGFKSDVSGIQSVSIRVILREHMNESFVKRISEIIRQRCPDGPPVRHYPAPGEWIGSESGESDVYIVEVSNYDAERAC